MECADECDYLLFVYLFNVLNNYFICQIPKHMGGKNVIT